MRIGITRNDGRTTVATTYYVRFDHSRIGTRVLGRNKMRDTRATTVCEITVSRALTGGDDEGVGAGVAHCSVHDRYDGRTGEAVALRRALENSGIQRADWPLFFNVLANRYRAPRLPAGAARQVERLKVALRRGDVTADELREYVTAQTGKAT